MKGFYEIGAIPVTASKVKVDLMPVDVSVEEVLALKDCEDMIYHIMSHIPVTLEEAVKALDESIQVVTEEEFIKILEEKEAIRKNKTKNFFFIPLFIFLYYYYCITLIPLGTSICE